MAAALLCVLTLTGCATIQLINSLHSQGYGGNWVSVDTAKTNAPSGAHLLGLLSADSAAVRLLVSQHGTPDYIRHDDPNQNISRVSFVFLKDNLFVVLDRISGEREDEQLDEVYERNLPPQYVALKKQREEEKRRQEQAEREARAKKEQMEREAKERARREAAAEQARKEKEAREKEAAEASKAFDLDALKQRADAQKGKTIVFKNFYIGMPIADCLQLVNNSMGLQQTLPTPIEDKSAMSDAKDGGNPESAFAAVMVQALGSQVQGMTPAQLRAQGLDDETIAALGITDQGASYRVYFRKGRQFIAKSPQEKPFAVADASGSVISFQLSRQILNKLFDAAGTPTEEFLQSFVNAYDLSGLESERQKITATIMGTTKEIGFQNVYRHRSDKGYEVMFYADSVVFDDDMKTFADTPPEGTMTIKKIETAKARESKFD